MKKVKAQHPIWYQQEVTIGEQERLKGEPSIL